MYFILSSFNYSNKRLDHGNMLFYQSSGSSLHLYMFPHILDWRISPHCWQIGRKNLCRKQDSGKSNCWANDGGAFHCFSSKFIHLYNRNCLIGVQWWWVVHLILLYQMSIYYNILSYKSNQFFMFHSNWCENGYSHDHGFQHWYKYDIYLGVFNTHDTCWSGRLYSQFFGILTICQTPTYF